MDIMPAIENVIRNHERILIDKFTLGDKTFDAEVFKSWMSGGAKKLRELFFEEESDPYKLDLHKLCYLFKYMPSMYHSSYSLINAWKNRHFQNWISKFEDIGICSLGSGPGSDIFGIIFALNNKIPDFNIKIKNIIRREKTITWEHYYQCVKTSIFNINITNNLQVYDSLKEKYLKNMNPQFSETLSQCHDEWVCDTSENWVKTYLYSQCNLISLQHVISDPSQTNSGNGPKGVKAISEELLDILSATKKPTILLISDINSQKIIDSIESLKHKISKSFNIKEVLKTETNNNIKMDYTDYLKSFKNMVCNYNHYQTIWEINDK